MPKMYSCSPIFLFRSDNRKDASQTAIANTISISSKFNKPNSLHCQRKFYNNNIRFRPCINATFLIRRQPKNAQTIEVNNVLASKHLTSIARQFCYTVIRSARAEKRRKKSRVCHAVHVFPSCNVTICEFMAEEDYRQIANCAKVTTIYCVIHKLR